MDGKQLASESIASLKLPWIACLMDIRQLVYCYLVDRSFAQSSGLGPVATGDCRPLLLLPFRLLRGKPGQCIRVLIFPG